MRRGGRRRHCHTSRRGLSRGHGLYALDTCGYTGPLIHTELRSRRATPTTFHPRGSDARLNAAPYPPVTFAGSGWSGHSVCWSPWFDGPRSWWRALIVRGDVLAALRRHIPRVVFRFEPVRFDTELPSRKHTPGRRTAHLPEPVQPPPLPALFADLARRSGQYRHDLSAGATDAEIEQDFARLPGIPCEALRRLLRLHNGAKLFDGALTLFGVGSPGSLVERNEEMARFPWFRREPGWIVFARPAGHETLWAINGQGVVHGLGCEEIVYGPQAPLEQWLADQISDLAYAWEHDGKFTWTERVLRG